MSSFAVTLSGFILVLEFKFITQNLKFNSPLCVSHSSIYDSLRPPRLLCPWDSPGKNIGVGCQFLLLGIFPTQGSNPDLLHCRFLYRLSLQGSICMNFPTSSDFSSYHSLPVTIHPPFSKPKVSIIIITLNLARKMYYQNLLLIFK